MMPDGPSQVVARQLLDPVLHVLTDRPDQVVTPHLQPGVDRVIHKERETHRHRHRHTDTYCLTDQIKL